MQGCLRRREARSACLLIAPAVASPLGQTLSVFGAQGRVTFYRNLEKVGDTSMPRQLTDCFNGLEGVLLGDAGLQLGQVRPALS